MVKPPYDRITVIDMNSGNHLRWIANADTPERIANHPLMEGVDLPPTRAGVLLTKTLLFVAEGNGSADAGPTMRAIDKETGDIIAEIELPDNQVGLPFTYEHDGTQYLTMFVGGGTRELAELIACTLR